MRIRKDSALMSYALCSEISSKRSLSVFVSIETGALRSLAIDSWLNFSYA